MTESQQYWSPTAHSRPAASPDDLTRVAASDPQPSETRRRRAERVVVLGCGGFIGSHLLDRLLEDPHVFVEGWDTSTAKIRKHLDHSRLTFHHGSIADASAIMDFRRAIERADAVINLAAVCNPSQYNTRPVHVIRANFTELADVVEMCAGAGAWLIHFSTSEVYGRTLASYVSPGVYNQDSWFELDEDSSPLIMGPIQNQRWTYACAKQLLERLVFAYHKELGMRFTLVRPLNLFGPRMDYIDGRDGAGVPRVLACFMGALLDGRPLEVVDGGGARRTILSIYDAIDAVILMLRHPVKAENQIFNLGNPSNEVTILELADMMRRTYALIAGDDSYNTHPIVPVHRDDFYGEGYEDCDRRMPRIDKARNLLHWEPKIPLARLLFETMTYYHANYALVARSSRPRTERRSPLPG